MPTAPASKNQTTLSILDCQLENATKPSLAYCERMPEVPYALPVKTAPVDVRSLTPTARALFWYLMATQPEQDVAHIVARSGIPVSSIYAAANRFPNVFELRGSLIRRATLPDATTGPTQTIAS